MADKESFSIELQPRIKNASTAVNEDPFRHDLDVLRKAAEEKAKIKLQVEIDKDRALKGFEKDMQDKEAYWREALKDSGYDDEYIDNFVKELSQKIRGGGNGG
jgi:5'-3' exonuclease